MYIYDAVDSVLVNERVDQYKDQLRRFLAGELSEDEFRPLRLQNGFYLQRHAPMLRVAIPYGVLSAKQLRKLGDIAEKYDHGYVHFTTRQNLQYNWPKLEESGNILADLATVQMHAIQTSGNCVRNISSDEYAGVAPDEIEDPRPYCEILRQWSTFHPEFSFLPRKFKIAVTGAWEDRAATAFHDIGLQLQHDANGNTGFRVMVGGGMGRTPILAPTLCEFLPWQHLSTYIESILRVYNRYGRRDNIYKARIKILVKALGVDAFRQEVERDWQDLVDGPGTLTQAELERVKKHFTAPAYETFDTLTLNQQQLALGQHCTESPAFARWLARNVKPHRVAGYRAVVISLKPVGGATGDMTAAQMKAVADWSESFGFAEIRVTHEQNLVLPHVRVDALYEFWQQAQALELASPTIGLLSDIISCPGGDFCSLANARSIPISQAIQAKFDDLDYLHDIGDVRLNISGCINSCGHHHAGHIGILGVDKDGQEWYQVSIGGADGSLHARKALTHHVSVDSVHHQAAIGKIIGPSFKAEQVPLVVERLLDVYLELREADESFVECVLRLGIEPFKTRVYATPIPLSSEPTVSSLSTERASTGKKTEETDRV